MFVEMVCACEATFHIDSSENEESAWFLVFRFANAHVGCGYMTEAQSDEAKAQTSSEPSVTARPKKRLIKPRRDDEDEET